MGVGARDEERKGRKAERQKGGKGHGMKGARDEKNEHVF